MNSLFIFAIGVAIGMLVMRFLISRKYERLIWKVREKDDKKKMIMKFMKEKGKINNDQAEQLAGVSDSTAERYLDELENEGKIKQIGKTGKHVYYEIVR